MVDGPKTALYVPLQDRSLLLAPDPTATGTRVRSQLTCGRWLDAGRLAYDRTLRKAPAAELRAGDVRVVARPGLHRGRGPGKRRVHGSLHDLATGGRTRLALPEEPKVSGVLGWVA